MHNYRDTGIGRIIGIGREVTGIRKDGTTFPFHLSISEVHLMDRRVFTGFIHDITEQKLSEERLRRYANELERSNLELQDFAYVSSHDLQEPLRKIQAFGDRLKSKESEKLSDQGKDYIDRMLNAASRMQSLINDLLTFSRVTTKAQPFCRVNLNEILAGVLSDLEVAINRSDAQIEAEKLPSIEAEPIQMRQLFQNLIANAIKFRKTDVAPHIKIYTKQLQRKAHLIATPGDQLLEIYVEDNGIGFDEKYLDKIFNVFQRLEGQKYEGSGIGLAICRKIAIRHGGNITARSQPGNGSIFIVTLAIKQPKSS
jgi:two-component system sensor kinase FixL